METDPRHIQQDSRALADLSELLYVIAKTDDAAAVEQLYHQCRRSIFTIAYAISRDLHLSEDILQETILYIWQHAGEHKRNKNPLAWIYVIARHTAIDMVRKRKGWDPLNEDIRTPEQHATDLDMDSFLSIRMGLDRLDMLEGQVFIFKVMLGLSMGQIAKILNISYRSVRYRYLKARQAMMTYLSDGEQGGTNDE